jgi:hypothetical protein
MGGDLQPLLVTELGDLLLDLGVDLLDCLLETLILLLVSRCFVEWVRMI